MDKRRTQNKPANPFETLDDPAPNPPDTYQIGPVDNPELWEVPRSRLRSRLAISNDTLIATANPLPNVWRRFWAWALLGWRWEKIN